MTEIVQRGGDHLGRRIEPIDAAVGQLAGDVRIEDEIPSVIGKVLAQALLHHIDVQTNAGRTPHIIDRERIARIVDFQALGNGRPDIVQIGQFGLIERLEHASLNLARQEIGRWHDNVVTALPSQKTCFKHFVGIENIVSDVDARLVFELFDDAFIDVIRPVEDAQFLRLCCQRRRGDQRPCKGSENEWIAAHDECVSLI